VGEPAGIGPELILQLAQMRSLDDIVVIGDAALLDKRAKEIGLEVPKRLAILDTPIHNIDCGGNPDSANVSGVINMLKLNERAVQNP